MPHFPRKFISLGNQNKHIPLIGQILRWDMPTNITGCLTRGEDTWISFPLPPWQICWSIPSQPPKQTPFTFIKYSQIVLQNVFPFLEPSNTMLCNPCSFLWNKCPLGRGEKQTHCAVSSFSPLSGYRGMEVAVAASMAGAWPRGNSAAFSCSTVRELHTLLQEGGRSWTHSTERLKGSGVLSSDTWSGTKESLFISFCCTALLYIPYKQLKKTTSSPFNQLWKRWKLSEETLSFLRMVYSHYRIIFKEQNCTRLIF